MHIPARSFRFLAAVVLALAPQALAAQAISTVAGTTYNAGPVTNANPGPADLVGLNVLFTYTDGGEESGVWESLSANNDDVFGVRVNDASIRYIVEPTERYWRIGVRGNLNLRNLRSVRLNGASSGIVFDCTWTSTMCNGVGPVTAGTLITSSGESVTTLEAPPGLQVRAEYANVVGYLGAPPVGDLFEQVTIFFDGDGLVDTGQLVQYLFDMDVERFASLTAVPGTVVPEPKALGLVGVGLAGLVVVNGRRRRGIRAAAAPK